MTQEDRVIVSRSAIDWLKKHYPQLCVKAGLCERVDGRLYTKTFGATGRLKAEQQEPVEATPYNLKRIAWELERTAMGDGFYGNALRVASRHPTTEGQDMTDKQPDALALADHLEQFRSFPDDLAAAAELRRLHDENEALRVANKKFGDRQECVMAAAVCSPELAAIKNPDRSRGEG